MPARKSRLAKADSASLRKVATGFATWPDSILICASSRTALSARSDLWKGLSAARTVKQAVKEKRATSAAAKPARTDASIKNLPEPQKRGRASLTPGAQPRQQSCPSDD